MSTPLPRSRCTSCGCWYQSHVCGERRLCPDGSGNSFTPRPLAKRAPASFDTAEVEWLASVLASVEQRTDLRHLARTPECASVARKVLAMRASKAKQP